MPLAIFRFPPQFRQPIRVNMDYSISNRCPTAHDSFSFLFFLYLSAVMTVKETGLPGRNRISRDSDSEHCPIESYYLIAIDLGGSRSRRRVFIFVSQWTTERNRIADSLVALATDDLCPTPIIITEGACKCRRYYVIVVCYCPPTPFQICPQLNYGQPDVGRRQHPRARVPTCDQARAGATRRGRE